MYNKNCIKLREAGYYLPILLKNWEEQVRKERLKTKISAILMAVSLAATGTFAGMADVWAVEEGTTTQSLKVRLRKLLKRNRPGKN